MRPDFGHAVAIRGRRGIIVGSRHIEDNSPDRLLRSRERRGGYVQRWVFVLFCSMVILGRNGEDSSVEGAKGSAW